MICGTEIKKIALIIFKFDNKEIFLSQIKKRASKNKQTMKWFKKKKVKGKNTLN